MDLIAYLQQAWKGITYTMPIRVPTRITRAEQIRRTRASNGYVRNTPKKRKKYSKKGSERRTWYVRFREGNYIQRAQEAVARGVEKAKVGIAGGAYELKGGADTTEGGGENGQPIAGGQPTQRITQRPVQRSTQVGGSGVRNESSSTRRAPSPIKTVKKVASSYISVLTEHPSTLWWLGFGKTPPTKRDIRAIDTAADTTNKLIEEQITKRLGKTTAAGVATTVAQGVNPLSIAQGVVHLPAFVKKAAAEPKKTGEMVLYSFNPVGKTGYEQGRAIGNIALAVLPAGTKGAGAVASKIGRTAGETLTKSTIVAEGVEPVGGRFAIPVRGVEGTQLQHIERFAMSGEGSLKSPSYTGKFGSTGAMEPTTAVDVQPFSIRAVKQSRLTGTKQIGWVKATEEGGLEVGRAKVSPSGRVKVAATKSQALEQPNPISLVEDKSIYGVVGQVGRIDPLEQAGRLEAWQQEMAPSLLQMAEWEVPRGHHTIIIPPKRTSTPAKYGAKTQGFVSPSTLHVSAQDAQELIREHSVRVRAEDIRKASALLEGWQTPTTPTTTPRITSKEWGLGALMPRLFEPESKKARKPKERSKATAERKTTAAERLILPSKPTIVSKPSIRTGITPRILPKGKQAPAPKPARAAVPSILEGQEQKGLLKLATLPLIKPLERGRRGRMMVGMPRLFPPKRLILPLTPLRPHATKKTGGGKRKGGTGTGIVSKWLASYEHVWSVEARTGKKAHHYIGVRNIDLAREMQRTGTGIPTLEELMLPKKKKEKKRGGKKR